MIEGCHSAFNLHGVWWYVFMHSQWAMTSYFLERNRAYALVETDFGMKCPETTWKPKVF